MKTEEEKTNLKQGKQLKTIRCHRNMTMKQLGMALGFDDSTAAIRIAQYDSDTRSPKPEMSLAVAKALNVHPNRLLPTPDNPIDAIIEQLLWLEDSETSCFYRESSRLAGFLTQYWWQKSRLLAGEISREEFLEWKLQWPEAAPMCED